MCGERLAAFVQRTTGELDEAPDAQGRPRKVTCVSLIGYSLGGLMARYAAGRLLADGYFDRVRPRNLVTVATPHLGSFRCAVAGVGGWGAGGEAVPLRGGRGG